jgi:DNA ligase-1
MKPQLADDVNLDSLVYPVMIQPKFDGVRGMNIKGSFTGRSLDPFQGFGITKFFSQVGFENLDGEMVLGKNPLSTERLCNRTSGAMGKFKGVTEMADLHWWIFDDLTDIDLPYSIRYTAATRRVARMNHPRVHIVPCDLVKNRAQLDRMIAAHLDSGAEGSIIRRPDMPGKEGRPGKHSQEYVRLKLWSHAEILVTEIIEGESNFNVATKNTLGKSERSSSKAGKVPNGQIGSLRGPLLANIVHPLTDKALLKEGTLVTVPAGEMTIAEATDWYNHPEKILNHIVTFKFLPHGMKDAPRMPTFKSKRLKEDMS